MTYFHKYSRTSIIRPSIIRNLDYPAWQFSCYQIRKWSCPSNAHARCSCYHGDMPAYLLRMRRQPCGTAVYQLSGWIKAWFIYSIIRHIHLSGLLLEPRCPDNRGSTVAISLFSHLLALNSAKSCSSFVCYSQRFSNYSPVRFIAFSNYLRVHIFCDFTLNSQK